MSRFVSLGKWAEQAACVGTPMSWWFPADSAGWAIVDLVPPQAAERCEGCPVRRQCHAHALLHEEFGVWGGMSEDARRRLWKAAGITAVTRAEFQRGDAG